MKIFDWRFLFVLPILLSGCNDLPSSTDSKNDEAPFELHGNTQGTQYTIICNDEITLSNEVIDSVLHQFDLALNTYINTSQITKLNNAGVGVHKIYDPNGYFRKCYSDAYKMYKISEGAFDPTVGPLVKAWGFKDDSFNKLDSATVDSILTYTSFEKGVVFDLLPSKDSVWNDTILVQKNFAQATLDFNAIAQGYAVDVLHDYIASKGGENFYVYIGGEVRVKGFNSEGKDWRIGVDKPVVENDGIKERQLAPSVIHIKDKSIATSGNYRKYYEEDGIAYVHTLDPKTGYPIKHQLLSATVIAETASIADAMATIFMVVGQNKGMEILRKLPEEVNGAYLIYNDNNGVMKEFSSPKIERMIHQLNQ